MDEILAVTPSGDFLIIIGFIIYKTETDIFILIRHIETEIDGVPVRYSGWHAQLFRKNIGYEIIDEI